MSIKVVKEPNDVRSFGPCERCCFCRNNTPFWFVEKDVAVCETCARSAEPEDVPEKKVWIRRERIAAGRF